jgi:hypothetical protein
MRIVRDLIDRRPRRQKAALFHAVEQAQRHWCPLYQVMHECYAVCWNDAETTKEQSAAILISAL